MLQIAICDDDKQIGVQIENIILAYSKNNLVNIEVEIYFSGEVLWAALQKGQHYDLIFLDIEMAELSGIAIGQKIRSELCNDLVQIVYISGESSYAMALFEVQPLNFLIKPIEPEKVNRMIDKVKKLSKQRYFEYNKGKSVFKIPLQEIVYFSSKGRAVTIHTREGLDGDNWFYGKLSDIAQEINDGQFMLMHKSYLVNYTYVKEYQYDAVILTNGLTISISQSQRPLIRDKVRVSTRKELF